MKKKNRNILFAKRFILIFLLVVFSTWSFLLAQEVKKYSPYPDVWEREFVDYAGWLSFIPIDKEDVFVYQGLKADRNGEAVKDANNNLVDLRDGILFFNGEVIKNYREANRIGEYTYKFGMNLRYYDGTHSCFGTKDVSDNIFLKDGTRIRWIKGLVVDRWNTYGQKGRFEKKEVDDILIDYQYEYPVNFPSHITYYNKPIILEKVDKDGRVLWQKAYLYFYPWWGHKSPRSMETRYDDFYSFYYIKLGCFGLVDENRIFLYFDGTKKIFRLDDDGRPRTQDRNLIVMNYKEYREFVEPLINKIDRYNKEQGEKSKVGISCCIQIKERGMYYTIRDYDYLGEQLSKKFHIPIENKMVKEIMREYKSLDKCIDVYKQLRDIK